MSKWIKRVSLAIAGLFVVGLLVLGFAISHTPDCEPRESTVVSGESFTAVEFRCYGSPDVLEVVDVEKPAPSGSEILVRVKAAGVNPLDWHYMRGAPYLMRLGSGIGTPDEQRMGVDFAGVVEAVGPDVTQFSPGDRVFGARDGAFAEYLVVNEDAPVVSLPDEVSFQQAASMPIAALTALQALRDKGQLQAGQKVLINGASGGVGTFAVQIAKALGAEVHGVCSARNVELVTSLGADRVFDYRQENYTESDQEYDLIVDMVGNHSIGRNRQVLKPDGRLVIVGGPKGNWIAPLKRPLSAMIQSLWAEQELIILLARLRRDDLAELASMVARGDVRPVIDYVFPLAETPDAIRYSETGRARGKIVIDMGAVPSP
jgi:NADPH:quinone reductase-like Zn-dependent oxidoreductase